MESEAESIRRAVAARTKQRYTPELRARILQYVRARRSAGFSQRAVAEEVSVKWGTLRRWLCDDEPQSQQFVPITVKPSNRAEPSVALVSPNGFRLEGLPPRMAVELFREL